MRNRLQTAVSILLMVAISNVVARASQTRKDYPLTSGWQFRQVGPAEAIRVSQWQAATVPGDVHLDLLKNGLIEDPFYRTNAHDLRWIENADWEYRDSIRVSPQMLAEKNIDLVFEGLDTNAQVYLNDELILTANNMYREWRIDARPHLHIGENTLRVIFPSPVEEAKRIASEDPWRTKTQTPTPRKNVSSQGRL